MNIQELEKALERLYPEPRCALEYRTAFELLIASRLSAQCTDKRVNIVTAKLFARYPGVEELAAAELEELEGIIRPCGLYHVKARDILGCAAAVRDGGMPDTLEGLLALPGVGRKIANLIMSEVYGVPGIIADTHCIRLSNRFGLCDTEVPEKVERRLCELIAAEGRSKFCHRLVAHGREVCTARNPRCSECALTEYCVYFRAH